MGTGGWGQVWLRGWRSARGSNVGLHAVMPGLGASVSQQPLCAARQGCAKERGEQGGGGGGANLGFFGGVGSAGPECITTGPAERPAACGFFALLFVAICGRLAMEELGKSGRVGGCSPAAVVYKIVCWLVQDLWSSLAALHVVVVPGVPNSN